ncbi:PEP-CTERM sorting domain-containing protein [bacterium]|nr:PEP-CTERM sorting domain-containing protein [bacterium]
MKRLGIILFGLFIFGAQPVAAQPQTSPSYAPTLANHSLFGYEFFAGSFVDGAGPRTEAVGPCAGLVGYSGVDRPMFTLYCVDFANRIYAGFDVTARVSNIGVGDVSLTRLGVEGPASSVYGTALQRYQKAAWLASLYFATPGTIHWSAIQRAIWTMMTPAYSIQAVYTNPYLGQIADPEWNPGAFNFNQWSVLTPVTADGSQVIARQEMLAQTGLLRLEVTGSPPTVTPEPETYLLLLSGMLFMVFFGRRRMKEMGYF